jgi:tetratricopeptide (TPR) repeat protein
LLERSPLAIVHASAFILQNSCDIDDYCRLYAQQREELLLQPHFRSSETNLSVFATLEIMLRKLEAALSLNARYALELLQIISFLHYEDIRDEMFRQAWQYLRHSNSSTWIRCYQSTVLLRDGGAERETEVLWKAISLLSSYSLISRHRKKGVFLHPLVKIWAQKRLSPADRRQTWAIAVSIIAASIPCTFGGSEYRFRQSLLPHLNACLSYYGYEVVFRLLELGDMFLSMASKFILVYQENGRRSEALQLMEAVVAVMKSTLSERNPINLSLMQELADRYTEVGRQQEASQLKESILAMSNSILREDHSQSVSQHSDSARSYNELGREVEASQIAKRLTGVSQKSLGEEHPTAVWDKNRPWLAPDAQVDLGNVEAIYRRILALRVRLLGTKHLDTPLSMKNFAEMLRSQSNHDEAVQVYQQTLASREVPDCQLLSTLLAMDHLAESLYNLDENEGLEQIHRQTLEMRKRALDRKQMSTSQNIDEKVRESRESIKLDEGDNLHLQRPDLNEEVPSTEYLTMSDDLIDNFQDSTRAERVSSRRKPRSQRGISFGEMGADSIVYGARPTATEKGLESESFASTAELDSEKFERAASQRKRIMFSKRQVVSFPSPSTGAATELAAAADNSSIPSSMLSKDDELSAFPCLTRLAGIFSDDDDIHQLLSEALVKHGHRRVKKNLTGLLAWLGHRLLVASNTSAEREIANLFLAIKRHRTFIDRVIECSSLNLSKEKPQDQESNTQSPKIESQRLAAAVALTEWSGGSPDVDLAIDPNDDEIDGSDDYGTERPNHDINPTTDEQQVTTSDVNAGLAFFKSSDAFARLKEEFEDFVRPFKNEKMWTKMLWGGDEQVRFELSNNVSRANRLDKLKLSVEHVLGMPVIWWPLRQPRRGLPASKVRITWICVS